MSSEQAHDSQSHSQVDATSTSPYGGQSSSHGQMRSALAGKPFVQQQAMLTPSSSARPAGVGDPIQMSRSSSVQRDESSDDPAKSTAAGADPAKVTPDAPPVGAPMPADELKARIIDLVKDMPGSATPGACNAETMSLGPKIFVASGHSIQPDRISNGDHYHLKVGDIIVDPTAAQFVNFPEGEKPPILVGTASEIEAQLGELVSKHGIRRVGKDGVSPHVPASITDAKGLMEAGYGGKDIKVTNKASDLKIDPETGTPGYFTYDKDSEAKHLKQTHSGPQPEAAPEGYVPPWAKRTFSDEEDGGAGAAKPVSTDSDDDPARSGPKSTPPDTVPKSTPPDTTVPKSSAPDSSAEPPKVVVPPQDGAPPQKAPPLTSDDVPKVPIKNAPEGTPVQGAEIQKDFGMPAANAKAFQDVADQYDVVIKVRPTNPKSVEMLEQQTALAKPEYLKAKSIKPEDFWLGADKSKEGTVGFFQPPSDADLEARLQAANPPLSEGEKQKIRDRRKERAAEFQELSPKMEKLQGDKNHPIYIQDGVVMDTKTGKPFTGDHDIFSITHRDGTPASPETVAKVVETLKPFGVEHGPHMNWKVPNDVMNQGIDATVRNNHTAADKGGDGEGLLCFGKEEPPKVGYHEPAPGEVDANKEKKQAARDLANGPKKPETPAADTPDAPKPTTDDAAPPTKRSAPDEQPKDTTPTKPAPTKPAPKPATPSDDGAQKPAAPSDDGAQKPAAPSDDGAPKPVAPSDDNAPPTKRSGPDDGASSTTPPKPAGADAGGTTPPKPAAGGTTPPPQQNGAPPQQNGAPPQQNGAPPQQNGAPPQQNGAPPQQSDSKPAAPKVGAPVPADVAPEKSDAPKKPAPAQPVAEAPAPKSSGGPKPAPDESTTNTPPKPSSEPPKRKITKEKSGALVDQPESADGKKPSNGSTSVDISDISKGKIDISYNYNLATIKQTLPILGAAAAGSGAGVFLELSASAGLFANGSVEVPPGEEGWSASVKGGIATNATLALKGGVQVAAGPVSAEATISAYAKADATAGCGVKVQGKGSKWEIAGRETGIEADVSASVGVAATLQAAVPGFSVGQTWNIAGPYTLPIVHASYPIEGKPSLALSQQVKSLPDKVVSGISGIADKIKQAAKQAVDDTVDSITGLDEKRKEEDAARAAGIEANNTAWGQWRAWKDTIGFNTGGVYNEVGRNATKDDVDAINRCGEQFVESYEAQARVVAAGVDGSAYDVVLSKCKTTAQTVVEGIKTRVADKKKREEAARLAKQAEDNKAREEIIQAQVKLRGRVMELAKAHDNLNYQGNKALTRGVSNARLHPHFDPANNAYLPMYNRANGIATSQSATVAQCGAVQSEVESLIGMTRAGAEAIKALA